MFAELFSSVYLIGKALSKSVDWGISPYLRFPEIQIKRAN